VYGLMFLPFTYYDISYIAYKGTETIRRNLRVKLE